MSAITTPIYYHREYSNDIKIEESDFLHEIKRIALVALPFLSLYKPLGFSLSLLLGGLRSVTTFAQSLQNPELATFLQTSIALIALGGTLFAHPLGMLLTTVHDLSLDCFQVIQNLYAGDFWGALTKYTFVVNNSLYLALFLHGGVQLAIASLAIQALIGLSQSLSEYRKGNYLEAGGHFLMGLIRGKQLLGQVQLNGNMMHTIAYYLQKPLQKSSEYLLRALLTPIRPGVEGNWENANVEKVSRCASVCLAALFAPITISLYTLGEGFHYCGNAINGTPYTYLRGEGIEKLDDQNLKCMSLNACMFWGGLPIPFGGLRPAGERIDELAQLIQRENPDVLLLQEASFEASSELFERLKSDYAHCFTRIGPNPMQMESGLMVLSKVPLNSPQFLPFPDQKGMQRGAFFIDTPSYTLINTHLKAGDEVEERKRQFDLITQKIEDIKRDKNRNFFLMGDLNIDRIHAEEEYSSTISEAYHDPRKDRIEESSTNVLVNHMRGKEVFAELSEMVDYALLHGDPSEVDLQTHFVDTYSNDRPYEALSDHKALILEINKK
ncbi:MAG: endonuclease/exonuclease/phosphatase family protein [Verrucomicrobia bacterium]|nr:endonuclease/exonuclease/phosphatase family protein [Verrucomicrobiota bacterium]